MEEFLVRFLHLVFRRNPDYEHIWDIFRIPLQTKEHDESMNDFFPRN